VEKVPPGVYKKVPARLRHPGKPARRENSKCDQHFYVFLPTGHVAPPLDLTLIGMMTWRTHKPIKRIQNNTY
jgi:hypothetical protein